MEQERGLFALPTRKTVPEDGRKILLRVLGALLLDEHARWDFKSPWRQLSVDEDANWQSRETIHILLRTFPSPKISLTTDSVTDDV